MERPTPHKTLLHNTISYTSIYVFCAQKLSYCCRSQNVAQLVPLVVVCSSLKQIKMSLRLLCYAVQSRSPRLVLMISADMRLGLTLTSSRTWFEHVSMLVILLNCVTLGMFQPCEDVTCLSEWCRILQVSMTLLHCELGLQEHSHTWENTFFFHAMML